MASGFETAIVAGASAVLGGVVAAGATIVAVERQLTSQRDQARRQEQLNVMGEWIETSLIYIDEAEYLTVGLDDLRERGGAERVDQQRELVDEVNRRRRGAYARLSLVCSETFVNWLGNAMAIAQDALDNGMGAAWAADNPEERADLATEATNAFKDFLDEAVIHLRDELSGTE